MNDKTPAQTPVSRSTDDLDRRLLQTLAAHEGPAGICPRVPRLATLLGVSESTLHRALRRLVATGQLERIAVFERDDDPQWRRRGHQGGRPYRQTTNSYRLLGVTEATNPRPMVETDTPPGVTASEETAAQTPVSPNLVTPLEGKEPADGGYKGEREEGERESAPHEPIEIAVEPPEHALLRRTPSERQLLATLTEAFGDVEVLSVVDNHQPATDYTTARGRVIDLTGGKKPEGKQAVRDLHQALGELARDTCRRVKGDGTERCTADQDCGRHAWWEGAG